MNIWDGGIKDLLSLDGQQYRIPVYQRNYAWTTEQCEKLFEDIVQAYERNRKHFTGTIVYQNLVPVKGVFPSIVIDGQQRLTTIYILLRALYDMAQSEDEKTALKQVLYNTDHSEKTNNDGTSKLKLKAAKENNDQLNNLINGEFDKIDKECKIYRNYNTFIDLITKQQDSGVTVSNIYSGINLLIFARIELDDNDNAQEIFESINSTGVPLRIDDLIRNYVFMMTNNHDYLYETFWSPIEKMIPEDNLPSFFSDYLNLKTSKVINEKEAYNIFKKVFKDYRFTSESMLSELYHYAKFYQTFLFGNSEYGEKVNSYLENLRMMNQTTLFVFLFRVFDDYENNVISLGELEKVMRFMFLYSMRRLVCEIPSHSLRGLYTNLYMRIFNRLENKNHYYDSIVSFFQYLSSNDALPSDATFISALKERNLYRKGPLCKFLLVSIENQGKEILQDENLTIEHIIPQKKELPIEWQEMLGIDIWREVREKYLHTLGNLTLTAYNPELSAKPYPEKKALLLDVASKVVKLNSEVKDSDVWNADIIEQRAERLSNEILRLFPIEEPEQRISFSDSRFQEYTCEDPETAKYKVPNYYVLQGERVETTTFAEMLRLIINSLYKKDKTIIERMARNNEGLSPTSAFIMFSYDPELFAGDKKIDNTDIYENSGFSAPTIMFVIKSLLDIYDIDRSEFLYSARSYAKKDQQDEEEELDTLT